MVTEALKAAELLKGEGISEEKVSYGSGRYSKGSKRSNSNEEIGQPGAEYLLPV